MAGTPRPLDRLRAPPDRASKTTTAPSLDTIAALVLQARDGDEQCFADLFALLFDLVYSTAYCVLEDSGEASDVVQEAFLAAWQNLASLDEPRAFRSWLVQITRNLAIDRTRKRSFRDRAMDDEGMAALASAQVRADLPADLSLVDITDPADVVADTDLAAFVWDSARGLSEKDLQILNMHVRQEMHPAEIGTIFDMNRNAANQLVHRVKRRFKEAVHARLLVGSSGPKCTDLAREVADLKWPDTRLITITRQHILDCQTCGERCRLHLSPAVLFTGVPLIVATPAVKASIAANLASAGVPATGEAGVVAATPVSVGGPLTTKILAGVGAIAGTVVVTVIAAMILGGSPPRAPEFTLTATGEPGSVFLETVDPQPDTTYRWSFGDGTGDHVAADSGHVFAPGGRYEIVLTAEEDGGSAISRAVVEVGADSGIVACSSDSPADGCTPVDVPVDATGRLDRFTVKYPTTPPRFPPRPR
ncbi:MAG: sigma-70 family RNA polymerase sigma factor [Acidimicrobiia bacterium]|nr:sigma-70 family RNA polymerase sigma factor [Acidimicrobiia bacterium]